VTGQEPEVGSQSEARPRVLKLTLRHPSLALQARTVRSCWCRPAADAGGVPPVHGRDAHVTLCHV